MASLAGDVTSTDESKQSAELKFVKDKLRDYSKIILPLNKVLEWEQTYYPAAVVGGITILFSIVWYTEPSVLTIFSVIGLLTCLADFVLPFVIGYFFGSGEFTSEQEKQYENICQRLLNAKGHVAHIQNYLIGLKNNNPKAYLLVMMGVFAVLAWIGSLIDNLLLTYLLVVFLTLLPGLRKHHIFQKAMAQANDALKKTVDSAGKGAKPKSN